MAETTLRARLFLERRGYTQRRLIDAARLLPVIGLVLWMLPLIWPRTGTEAGTGAETEGVEIVESALQTSNATLYVFVVWIALIVCGAYLASRMGFGSDQDESNAAQDKHPKEPRAPE